MISIETPFLIKKEDIRKIYDNIKRGGITLPYTIKSEEFESDCKKYKDDKLKYIIKTIFDKDSDDNITLTSVKEKINGYTHVSDVIEYSDELLANIKKHAKVNTHLLPFTVDTSPNDDGEFTRIRCFSEDDKIKTQIQIINRSIIRYSLKKTAYEKIKKRRESFGKGDLSFTKLSPVVDFEFLDKIKKGPES